MSVKTVTEHPGFENWTFEIPGKAEIMFFHKAVCRPFQKCMELHNIKLLTIAEFTLSYTRYGKPRKGYYVMQLHAHIWGLFTLVSCSVFVICE